MEYPALTIRRYCLAFIALIFVATAFGIPELRGQATAGEPYFSLSSDKTFKSDQQPSIHLYASNVKSLEFRVYRVNDAVEFFKGLEDLHSFGGRARRLPQELTLIERFHRLKSDLRFRIVNTFRAQYTKDSRAAIRDRMQNKPAPKPADAKVTLPGKPPVETYPEVPLLNRQQVVAVWRQPVSAVRRWDSQSVSFD